MVTFQGIDRPGLQGQPLAPRENRMLIWSLALHSRVCKKNSSYSDHTRRLSSVVQRPKMSSSPDEGPFDYTDGATPVEITGTFTEELYSGTRTRRDSQLGSSYDVDENELASSAIFDGYGAGTIPSSVTSMHHDRVISWSRERRTSQSSRDRYHSSGRSRFSRADGSVSSSTGRLLDPQDPERASFGERRDSDVDDAGSYDGRRSMQSRSAGSTKRRRPRREHADTTSPSRSSTMLQSFAGMFSRASVDVAQSPPESRSGSVSRRSSAASNRPVLKISRRRSSSRHSLSSSGSGTISDDGTERWGYSSGEEIEEEGNRYASPAEDSLYARSDLSRPPSPTSSLPILESGPDPLFEDIRIDMGEFDSFHHFATDPLPLGPPSRQTIYIEDEDMTVLFIGREIIQWKAWLWTIGCFTTLGILGLVGFWNNSIWIRWATRDKSFESLGEDGSDGIIVIEVWVVCE